MPVIKSAKKKLKQDIKREKANKIIRLNFKNAVKEAKESKTAEKIKKAVQMVDKATKKRIIHKNKAARIKSKLNKLIKPAAGKTKSPTKTAKKTRAPKNKNK